MNMPAKSATQVVIVGGGPVGLGLAIDLGQRGINCVLVERYVSPQPIPKGQNLTSARSSTFTSGARRRSFERRGRSRPTTASAA